MIFLQTNLRDSGRMRGVFNLGFAPCHCQPPACYNTYNVDRRSIMLPGPIEVIIPAFINPNFSVMVRSPNKNKTAARKQSQPRDAVISRLLAFGFGRVLVPTDIKQES